MIHRVEDVFKTEGIPPHTLVKAPNFNELLVDIRTPGKPVIVEGQSGTGKTTTVRTIIETALPGEGFIYLSARKAKDMAQILAIAAGGEIGKFVIDDFHRLDDATQEKIGNLMKVAAEDYDEGVHPKIIAIGINKVGSELIHLVHDLARRCGIHKIQPASFETTSELIGKGEALLNIQFTDRAAIFGETRGDYWLTQLVCQALCLMRDVTQTNESTLRIDFEISVLRAKVTERLDHAYSEPVTEFCRGNRFRSTNDPYLKLLKCVSEQPSSIVDLTELANANPASRGSINNVKESRLGILIDSKPICERYFYYNSGTKNFAIEDPALFYYIKHLDWEALRKKCGFRGEDKNFDFDFAISFAGENRQLAREIQRQLQMLDCSVFFDELYEANYLGQAWHKAFKVIFAESSRFVVCLIDKHYLEKIWPTFERETFLPRVDDAAVIPILMDDTTVPGIPKDIVGVRFKNANPEAEGFANLVTDEIVFKLQSRLENV